MYAIFDIQTTIQTMIFYDILDISNMFEIGVRLHETLFLYIDTLFCLRRIYSECHVRICCYLQTRLQWNCLFEPTFRFMFYELRWNFSSLYHSIRSNILWLMFQATSLTNLQLRFISCFLEHTTYKQQKPRQYSSCHRTYFHGYLLINTAMNIFFIYTFMEGKKLETKRIFPVHQHFTDWSQLTEVTCIYLWKARLRHKP